MPLTDIKLRNTKAKDKQFKVSDQHGLYLLVTPAGGKLWRFDYRFEGKRKTLAFGSYPEISLIEARKKLLEARTDLQNDVDPGARAKVEKKSSDFKSVALEWYERLLPSWSKGHARTVKSRLERDVFPWIGDRPINEITPPEVLRLLRRVESRGAVETAHRIKVVCGQVFRYAVATGNADSDPSRDLRDALSPPQPQHMAAITEPGRLADLIRAINGYKGTFVVKCALQVQAYTFVRPGELRHAEWSEIDLETGTWSIPAEKMKIKNSHIVPLSTQVVEILQDLHPLTGSGKYVFPNARTALKPLSENAILAALRNMGFEKREMSGHGFRAAARTILDEVLNQRVDFIEHQLAHTVKDPNRRAYNRTAYLDERRKMLQLWADYLDGFKAEAKIIPLHRKA